MPASEHESSGEGRQWRLVLREKRETRVRCKQGGNSNYLAGANMERQTNEGPFWLPAKSKIVENSITSQTYDVVKCEIKLGFILFGHGLGSDRITLMKRPVLGVEPVPNPKSPISNSNLQLRNNGLGQPFILFLQ